MSVKSSLIKMTWYFKIEHTKFGKPVWKVEEREIYNEMKENAMKKRIAYWDYVKKTGIKPKLTIVSAEAIIICPK